MNGVIRLDPLRDALTIKVSCVKTCMVVEQGTLLTLLTLKIIIIVIGDATLSIPLALYETDPHFAVRSVLSGQSIDFTGISRSPEAGHFAPKCPVTFTASFRSP
jgi:hypothetical protein